ncbi:carbohydrate ABC transporter permease [Acholeplasma manati]|uniref:Carbohydrate ABC transporter permease n=1 Tax=Paracholeplasma manati TaxID=591373 RepID=A0ABT2Y466_9MOLU|nr:carbohydrate ABC transporter permease [Paracholeplasma manati]MCV2231530.1 carbohydrate ABC transporter permease [Paracholeplasma manati]
MTHQRIDFSKSIQRLSSILKNKRLMTSILAKSTIYTLLTIIGFIFLYPILYMVSTSFKDINDLLDASVIWIPNKLSLENYQTALVVLGLPTAFMELFEMNALYQTILVVGVPSITATIATGLIGYGFARFNFPLKKVWLVCVIVGFIIPQQVILLPQFVYFNNQLKILGTLWSYILPAATGQGLNAAVFILIFYSFFSMIPKSLDESAYMDGANELSVFWHIGVKLSKQPIIIVFLFNFVWYWNDYYRASYFLTGSKWTTLPLKLSRFENTFATLIDQQQIQTTNLNEPLILAGTLLTVLPLLVIYFVFQKFFVESIDRTGISGE